MVYFSRFTLLCSLCFAVLSAPLSAAAESAPAKETPQEQAKAATPQDAYPDLVAKVEQYMAAWRKQDFSTMNAIEAWNGGEALEGFRYMQQFDPDFKLHSWKVTKVTPRANDGYTVLVLIEHNPPKQVAAFVSNPDLTVRSTLRQVWEKSADGAYQHLYHIEKQEAKGPGQAPLPLDSVTK